MNLSMSLQMCINFYRNFLYFILSNERGKKKIQVGEKIEGMVIERGEKKAGRNSWKRGYEFKI